MRAGVVTPEAVLLDLPTAGVATRAFARLLDLFVQLAVAMVLFMAAGFVSVFGVSSVLISLVIVAFVLLVWPIGLEILWRGRSVGKAAFGLQVIGADGSPVQPRQSMIRGLLALIEVYLSLGFIALLAAMFSPSAQRLGDVSASTVVVRTRRRARGSVPVVFYPPPGYEAYVSSMDVSRLSAEEFSIIREFLLRVGGLSPDARFPEAVALAEATKYRIDHQLPADIEPETFLVCVASAFQWREGGLLRDVSLGLAPVSYVLLART
ncbi:MAG: RDD family protein [Microthrixaceae bacterium]